MLLRNSNRKSSQRRRPQRSKDGEMPVSQNVPSYAAHDVTFDTSDLYDNNKFVRDFMDKPYERLQHKYRPTCVAHTAPGSFIGSFSQNNTTSKYIEMIIDSPMNTNNTYKINSSSQRRPHNDQIKTLCTRRGSVNLLLNRAALNDELSQLPYLRDVYNPNKLLSQYYCLEKDERSLVGLGFLSKSQQTQSRQRFLSKSAQVQRRHRIVSRSLKPSSLCIYDANGADPCKTHMRLQRCHQLGDRICDNTSGIISLLDCDELYTRILSCFDIVPNKPSLLDLHCRCCFKKKTRAQGEEGNDATGKVGKKEEYEKNRDTINHKVELTVGKNGDKNGTHGKDGREPDGAITKTDTGEKNGNNTDKANRKYGKSEGVGKDGKSGDSRKVGPDDAGTGKTDNIAYNKKKKGNNKSGKVKNVQKSNKGQSDNSSKTGQKKTVDGSEENDNKDTSSKGRDKKKRLDESKTLTELESFDKTRQIDKNFDERYKSRIPSIKSSRLRLHKSKSSLNGEYGGEEEAGVSEGEINTEDVIYEKEDTVKVIKQKNEKLKPKNKKKTKPNLKTSPVEPLKHCPCPLCEFMNRREIEESPAWMKQMIADQERRDLLDYYKKLRQRSCENFQSKRSSAPQHKADQITCQDDFCHLPNIAEAAECYQSLTILQQLLRDNENFTHKWSYPKSFELNICHLQK